MGYLANDLPTYAIQQPRPTERFVVIDTRNRAESNLCTAAQVAIAKGKGWIVWDENGAYDQVH